LPSVTHQALASLFRENPAFGLRLLQSATGASLPAGAQARLHAAQFTDLRPPEYAADAACLIEDQAGKALGALIVEIQLSPDELKQPSWLSYTATLHRALLVPVTVLAVALTEDMERWCARPYAYDHLGSTFRPLVIGPSAIPRITDVEQARALPELALLSVAAHGREPGAEAAGRAAGRVARKAAGRAARKAARRGFSWPSRGSRRCSVSRSRPSNARPSTTPISNDSRRSTRRCAPRSSGRPIELRASGPAPFLRLSNGSGLRRALLPVQRHADREAGALTAA
jgi:hypothetical protein